MLPGEVGASLRLTASGLPDLRRGPACTTPHQPLLGAGGRGHRLDRCELDPPSLCGVGDPLGGPCKQPYGIAHLPCTGR